ncbi:DNA repair protein RadC [Burkholderiaceae bacterium DAT-1]|nr:DNA repair protein RadC [Burkholderiaceae bacterium DAT-1]
MSIRDWNHDQRPRERLMNLGAGMLSDAELLAIFLRVGIRGKSAVDLAHDLLREFRSLGGLFTASHTAISAVPGMGDAKYAQLQAVLEMARRALGEPLQQRDVMSNPAIVRDYLRLWIGSETREAFGVLFLDSQHAVLSAEILFRGTLTQASVHPREVARRALSLNAAAVIVAHNHPSGVAEPSRADRHMTEQLRQSLGLLDIRLLDHVVVSRYQSVSFAERGWSECLS